MEAKRRNEPWSGSTKCTEGRIISILCRVLPRISSCRLFHPRPEEKPEITVKICQPGPKLSSLQTPRISKGLQNCLFGQLKSPFGGCHSFFLPLVLGSCFSRWSCPKLQRNSLFHLPRSPGRLLLSVDVLEKDPYSLLTILQFDATYWTLLRTITPIEQPIKEFERQTRAMEVTGMETSTSHSLV